MEKAKVSELFSSIQGEGLYVGRKEIFIRFSGCNLRCVFCDVNKKGGKFYTGRELVEKVHPHTNTFGMGAKWLTLTGGEPLLWCDFLKEFLPLLKDRELKIVLETNGTMPEKFRNIKDLVDIVALDFKLPSSTQEKPFWSQHRQFLNLAKDKSFVKVVITAKTISGDLKKAIKIISEINQEIPLVLQPVTPHKKFKAAPPIEKVLKFQQQALKFLTDVRVIPQVHKFLKLK